jgi:DNA replication protein DnaC
MSDKKLSDFFAEYKTDLPKRAQARQAVFEWSKGVLENQPSWLVLHSPNYGTGKTSLARAAFNAFSFSLINGFFITAPDLLDDIRATYNGGNITEAALFRQWRKAQFFILDDFGKQYTREKEWEAEKWFRLVDGMEQISLLVTSNLTPIQFAERIGGAAASRFGRAKYIDMSGLPDYRLTKK